MRVISRKVTWRGLRMNKSKWNAYHIAEAIGKHKPEGVDLATLKMVIRRTCGEDERTIKKYLDILRETDYIIEDKGVFKAHPNLDSMKPKSPKQLLEEWDF